MLASVVVCTYNRSSSLKKTLASLEGLLVPEGWIWELIIVDNNSSDNTRNIAETFVSETPVEAHYVFERQQGLSNARNRGIREAKGEIVAFSDDDIRFDAAWLFHLIAALETHDCVCVAGKIIPEWVCGKPAWLIESGRHKMRAFDGRFDHGNDVIELDSAPFGANMAFRRSVFDQYGLFRRDLGRSGASLMSCEETELCARFLSQGNRVIYTPDAKVYHLLDESIAQKEYYLSRYFSHGRSVMRAKVGSETECRMFAGIPRKLFRRLFRNLLKWAFARDPGVRFFFKLSTYRVVGEIVEAGAQRKRGG